MRENAAWPSEGRRRHDRLMLFVLTLAGLIPVWIPTFPPMTDLPQHASQVGLLGSVLGHTSGLGLSDEFVVNWFTPYLVGYLLVFGFASVFKVVTACKIVVSLALGATPLATRLILSETPSDPRWAILTIPAMYGFAYQWGFLNFLVAVPLGLLCLWLTMTQVRQPTLVGRVALAGLFVVLFFAHAMIAVFCGTIAGLLLLRRADGIVAGIRELLPLLAVVPLGIGWGLKQLSSPLVQRGVLWDTNWFYTVDFYYRSITPENPGWGWGRASGFFPRLLGAQPSLALYGLGLAILVMPWASGGRITRLSAQWMPFRLCLAVLFCVPSTLFGTDFTYQRFTIFFLPFYFCLWTAPEGRCWPRWTWPAAAVLALSWTAVIGHRAIQYEREAAGFDAILNRMEPGSRAVSFAFERDSTGAIAPAFLHFPAWYGAIKGGIVDPNIAGTHVQMVVYRQAKMPAIHLWDFEWFPERWAWTAHSGVSYRYFVVKSATERRDLFVRAPCRVWLLLHVNHWWLYERDSGCLS